MRDQTIKVRENRLRRSAKRNGLKLLRSPRRDTHAIDYNMYALESLYESDGMIHKHGPISPFALTLDDVDIILTSDRRGRP